jgi:ferric-dicitrate binding protein FerR (iron transport regulator)
MNIRIIVSLMAILLFAGSALADGTSGRLVEVNGKVWIQAPEASKTIARAGITLAPGTKILTGPDGKAEISLEDGSIIVVQQNSSMVLSGIKRQKKKKTSILIFFGRIWNKVSSAVGGRAGYEVNTPIVVCGVRGTEFETAVADDGSVRVIVNEGTVNVKGDKKDKTVSKNQEIDADTDGVGKIRSAKEKADWEKWQNEKRERMKTNGRSIMDNVKSRIMARKEKLEDLRARQKDIEEKRKLALKRAQNGDQDAIEEIRRYNEELIAIADEIADLGDAAGSQFGIVNHFADLATDPRFQMIDGKYVEAEAASMGRIKAMFDKMIKEGTDISMEAMEKMLDEMSDGQRGSLKFEKGSSKDDLFRDQNKE